jgi:transposase
MRHKGSSEEHEHRRLLAVQRVLEGYTVAEVAEFLGVDPRSVRRWFAAYREGGEPCLLSRPVSGRPPKLNLTQEKIVRRWLGDSPSEHGFETELWTASRLGQLIQEEFGVRLNFEVSQRVAEGPGVHAAEAAARPPRARRQGDRRVAGVRLAAHQKKAQRQGAHIALIDESGLLMGPLLRRTWSPKGRTPEILQGGTHRQKVSVAAAVWLSPRRDHLGLYFHTLADGYFDSWYVTAFIEAMLWDLSGRFVVVWDGGPMHKGEPIRALETQFADRLILEALPPWAPMLNPVEPLWSWLKWERLSNFAPHNVGELDERVVAEMAAKRNDQVFLKNLFHASELPLPRTLLS